MTAVPVIALTGYLGSGKTTLLNHVLRTPYARIGVVINDFGELNVDAALVSGQVDEAASIAGGCICCLPEDGALDAALTRLADPALRLDAIIIEASGVAEPAALARIVGFSSVAGVRPGGVIDVIDAVEHFRTVDRGGVAPNRYAAASLTVVNKLDRVPDPQECVQRIGIRIRQTHPQAQIIGVQHGRIDPTLLFDIAGSSTQTGQLSLRDVLVDEAPPHHTHATSVTVASSGTVNPDTLLDLVEQRPAGVYRIKGFVAVQHGSRVRRYAVQVVGPSVQISAAPAQSAGNTLVAIGTDFDTEAVRADLGRALTALDGPASATALRRLRRYRD